MFDSDRVPAFISHLKLAIKRGESALRGHPSTFVFAVAFCIRLLPEFFSGVYPVGYDLLAGYAPSILTFPDTYALSLFRWEWSPLAIAILWGVRRVTGISLYLLLKIAAPVFYGLLASSFLYAIRQALNWNVRKSLLATSVLILEPAILRIGWDQLRLELGLFFLFLLIAITKGNFSSGARRKPFLTIALALLTVLSQPLAAVLLLIIVGSQSMLAMIGGKWGAVSSLFLYLPAGALFVIGIYETHLPNSFSSHLAPIGPPSGSQVLGLENYLSGNQISPGGSFLGILAYVVSLSIFCIIPMIPLSVMGAFKDKVLTPLTAWLLVGSYSLIILPSSAISVFWWWTILLSIPLTIYAVKGLERHGFLRGSRFKITVAGLLLLSVLAVGYSVSAISLGSSYTYPFLPSGLVQSSVHFADIPNVENAVLWASGALPMSGSVIVPEQFQGFAAAYFRSDLAVRIAPPLLTLEQARSYYPAHGQIFAIYYSNQIGTTLQYVTLAQFGSIIVCEFQQ